MKEQFEAILEKTLSGFLTSVKQKKSFYGSEYLAIQIACSDYNINNVDGQKPQLVSLMLELDTLELHTQVFGGFGGGSIYRNIRPEDPKERYLAMQSIKIPFRKPKATSEAVLKAFEKFCISYKETLRENVLELRYTDIVDYSNLLK